MAGRWASFSVMASNGIRYGCVSASHPNRPSAPRLPIPIATKTRNRNSSGSRTGRRPAAALAARAQEPCQALHRRLQYGRFRRVADADRALAARAEGHTGRQPDARFLEQPPAEAEGIFEALDPREQVEIGRAS